MEEPLEMMARVIKEETHGKKLTCFFYGYLFDMHGIPMGPQNSGHLAMARMLQCPDVDILCSPISYLDRELGGAGMFHERRRQRARPRQALAERRRHAHLSDPAGIRFRPRRHAAGHVLGAPAQLRPTLAAASGDMVHGPRRHRLAQRQRTSGTTSAGSSASTRNT